MRMVGLDRLACIGLLLLAAAGPAEQGQAPPPSAAKAKHAQHRPPHHARQPVASRATRPEAPRVATAPGFTPAPVPRLGKDRPGLAVESRTHAEPTLFDLGNKYQGDGYVYGSSPQGMDDRRAAKVPGVEVKVPLSSKSRSTLALPGTAAGRGRIRSFLTRRGLRASASPNPQ